MSVTVTDSIGMTIQEIPPSNTTLITTSNAVQFDSLNQTQTLTSSTTPAVTKQVSYQVALSTGALTIDLTSMAGGTNGATVTFSGLKVCGYLFENPSTNANSITIVGGASSGYLIFGTAGSVVLAPGHRIKMQVKQGTSSGLPTVDGTHKNIDLSGTGSQVLNVQMIAG